MLALILPAVILAAWIYTTTFTQIPAGILPGIPRVWKAFLDMTASGQTAKRFGSQFNPRVKRLCGIGGAWHYAGVADWHVPSGTGNAASVYHRGTADSDDCMDTANYSVVRYWRTLKSSHYRTGGIFPVLVNTESGIAGTPESFLEVAKLYKLNPWKTLQKFICLMHCHRFLSD